MREPPSAQAQIPSRPPPPPLNLLPSLHLYPSGRKQHLPLLPHFLLSESFFSLFLFSCRDFFLFPHVCWKNAVDLPFTFLAPFPAPTVEVVFSLTGYVWTLNLLSQTTLATGFSLTQDTPQASSWHKSHLPTPPPTHLCWNLINSSIISFGGECHLYSGINKTACQLDLLFRTKNMDLKRKKMLGYINFNCHILLSQPISLPFLASRS